MREEAWRELGPGPATWTVTWSGKPGRPGDSEPQVLLDNSFARARCPLKTAWSKVAAWQGKKEGEENLISVEDGREGLRKVLEGKAVLAEETPSCTTG